MQRRVLKTQIIQKTIKHQPFCECWETCPVEYISLNNMDEYEWTLPQAIIWISHFKLFCHNVKGACPINVVKNSQN